MFHDGLREIVSEGLHPEDETHDEQVGRALRTAIEGRDPAKATDEYNTWARTAGYEPVTFLGVVDGKVRADIVTAVIEVGEDYALNVVEGVCR